MRGFSCAVYVGYLRRKLDPGVPVRMQRPSCGTRRLSTVTAPSDPRHVVSSALALAGTRAAAVPPGISGLSAPSDAPSSGGSGSAPSPSGQRRVHQANARVEPASEVGDLGQPGGAGASGARVDRVGPDVAAEDRPASEVARLPAAEPPGVPPDRGQTRRSKPGAPQLTPASRHATDEAAVAVEPPDVRPFPEVPSGRRPEVVERGVSHRDGEVPHGAQHD